MKDKIRDMLNQRFYETVQKYGNRLNELLKEYNEKDSVEEKNKIVMKIIRLSRVFDVLQKGYEEAIKGIVYNIESRIEIYDKRFEDTLNDEPLEYV